MKKFLDKIIDFFKKNPLWVIVILLILMSVLLLNISLRIGHDYISEDFLGQSKRPTGLYRTIDNVRYNVSNSCDLSEIKERLNDIYYSLPY